MTRPGRLYHFTCNDGHKRIGCSNCLIIPQVTHPLLRIHVSWFTTEAVPDREATGLTHRSTSCDRMAHRYVISDISGCRPWLGSVWRMAALAQGEPGAVDDLEHSRDPQHWWIAACAIPAEWDRTWTPVASPERNPR